MKGVVVNILLALMLVLFDSELAQNLESSKIIGGEEVVPHSRPYQAAIFLFFTTSEVRFCGGSIISQKYILTAAHCLAYNVTLTEVILGAHNIREFEPTQLRYLSSDFIIHKNWEAKKSKNDIALIKLPEPIDFNDVVQPIRLPCHSNNNYLKGLLTDISGWGKISDQSNTINPLLRHVEVKIISNFVCKLAFFGIVTDQQICTSGLNRKGSCNGDSGGPLTITEDDGIKTLYGIVSFGIVFGCTARWPSVFTKIPSYLSWIELNSDVIIRP